MCAYSVIMRLILIILFLVVANGRGSPGANTTRAAAALDDETDDTGPHNRLFPKVPRCQRFDDCSILVFSIALVCFLVALACALCYAMHNKRQQREKLVPCDAYCTCPAHANA